MLEECAPASLVLLRPLANAEDVPIAALIHADRNQQHSRSASASSRAFSVSSTLPRTTRSRWLLIRSSSIVMTLFNGLGVVSVMAAPSRRTGCVLPPPVKPESGPPALPKSSPSGRPLLSTPPTATCAPSSGTHVPPSVIDDEALAGPGMKDVRFREPLVDQLLYPFPRDAIPLAAPPEHAKPEMGDVVMEPCKCATIRRHGMIVEVACNDLLQPLSLFG